MAFPSRYRSRSGSNPSISPIKLSPVNEEDLPALRPDMHASAIQGNDGPSPLPPPPITIPKPPRQFRTTFDREMAKPRPISPIAPANSRYGGIKGMMAPPGIKRHAVGDIVGLDGPELGIVGEGPNPELVAPLGGTAQPISQQTQLPPLDQDALPDTKAEGTRDLPVDEEAKPEAAPEPPPAPEAPPEEAPAPAALPDSQALAVPQNAPAPSTAGVTKATKALENLTPPARPDNNWAQRLGLAVLSMTKFAPIANQIIHPKWADQQSAYAAQQADLERRQKEEETAATTEASVAQKEAQAAYRRAESERQAQLHDERMAKVNEAQNASFLKALGPDAYQVPDKNEALPEGYHLWTSPTGAIYARPGGAISIPPEMVPLFPGSKPGDLKTRKEYDTALQQYRAQQNALALEAAKAGDRDTSKQITPEQRIAAIAAGVDPSDPSKWTPDQARAVNKEIEKHKQAIHVNVNTGAAPLSTDAVDQAARRYLTSGELPSLGMGKEGGTMRTAILNRAAEIGKDADIAANKATYGADKGSLASLQKNRDNVVAFEGTAGKNLDLFLKQAKPIVDAGSQWINQPIRSIQKSALGSADVAAYDTARQVALNEIAKVTSNPGLTGQLSDSARKEVGELLPESATLAQIYRVANVLKQDMKNRHDEYDRQLKEIQDRMRGKPQSSVTPSGIDLSQFELGNKKK